MHRCGSGQVLIGGQVFEDAAAFEHMRDAKADALGSGQAPDVRVRPAHAPARDLAALGGKQAADGLERRALARAVAPEQGRHAARPRLNRDALDGKEHLVVDHLDIVEDEHGWLSIRCSQILARRRWEPEGECHTEGIPPHPVPLPASSPWRACRFECPHPQADADGRGNARTAVATALPLPWGEGWGEGRFPRYVLTPAEQLSLAISRPS